MTDGQARVLLFIRRRGEVRAGDLTSYQWRSVKPLADHGHVLYVTCGECLGCRSGMTMVPESCERLKIRAAGNTPRVA